MKNFDNNNHFFILTVDTEPDNEWSRLKKSEMTFNNVNSIEKFQSLCDKYSFKPVYLVEYQMLQNNKLISLLNDFLSSGKCEVGAHMHPWSNPPLNYKVTEDDYPYHPFIVEYPSNIFEDKLKVLLRAFKDTLNLKPKVFRAGRWVISAENIRILKKYGFKVDCSVTPYRHWEPRRGIKESDYRNFNNEPFYWTDSDGIVEIPLSCFSFERSSSFFNPYSIPFLKNNNYYRRLLDIFFRTYSLTLKGGVWSFRYKKYSDLNETLKYIHKNHSTKYLQSILHSSELSLGGCFKRPSELEKYWDVIEKNFQFLAKNNYQSVTMEEYLEILKETNGISSKRYRS